MNIMSGTVDVPVDGGGKAGECRIEEFHDNQRLK
jgi:hypothetical protein